MSRIIQVFLLVLFGLPIHAMAQKTAIKIVSELTNHTADSRESFLVTEIIGDDFYYIVENLSSQENFTLINFRDNKMEYYVSGEFMFVSSLDDWRLFQEEGELPFKVVKEYPNKTRTIHGRKAMLVDLQITTDELVREGWVDKKLFNKFKNRYGLELTEGMLEFSFEDPKMEYSTLSVEEIEITEDLYTQLSSSTKESKEKGQALLASRDSLILELQEKEQKYSAKSISSFQQGMARIEKGQQAFYINSQGD
ncbi:MAG TPA: hypothetical protein VK076_10850, partial [Candidatus Sphingobacterium stercoripullorum]|nr:hypothetical protein [Candidatus Sphingobacterium stercoripullorum]